MNRKEDIQKHSQDIFFRVNDKRKFAELLHNSYSSTSKKKLDNLLKDQEEA